MFFGATAREDLRVGPLSRPFDLVAGDHVVRPARQLPVADGRETMMFALLLRSSRLASLIATKIGRHVQAVLLGRRP